MAVSAELTDVGLVRPCRIEPSPEQDAQDASGECFTIFHRACSSGIFAIAFMTNSDVDKRNIEDYIGGNVVTVNNVSTRNFIAMTDVQNRPYHHGDLRRTIIETALNMLRDDKNWQFTLREVARRAGVSHAAPYKHFSDKTALLVELALIGFDRLREALAQAKPEAPPSLIEEITPISRAYVAFGTDNPALYRLMFSAEEGQAVGMHLDERALAVFDVVLEMLGRGQATGSIRKRPVRGQAAAAWALIHGITMLAIDGLLVPEKVGSAPLEAALATLVEGLATPQRLAT